MLHRVSGPSRVLTKQHDFFVAGYSRLVSTKQLFNLRPLRWIIINSTNKTALTHSDQESTQLFQCACTVRSRARPGAGIWCSGSPDDVPGSLPQLCYGLCLLWTPALKLWRNREQCSMGTVHTSRNWTTEEFNWTLNSSIEWSEVAKQRYLFVAQTMSRHRRLGQS